MERVRMRIEVARAETLRLLDQHFRERTQKKEELEETEIQLQVGRGVMMGFEKAQDMILEVLNEDKLEAIKQTAEKEMASDKPPPFDKISEILGISTDTLVDAWNLAENHHQSVEVEVSSE